MKKLIFLYVKLLACMAAAVFVSCEDDKDSNENMDSNKIIGLWQFFYSDDEVDGGYVDNGGYLDIRADGTYAFYNKYTLETPHLWHVDDEGIWRIENDEFCYIYTDQYGNEDIVRERIKSVSDTELRLIASYMYEDRDVEMVYRRGNIDDIEFVDENIFVGDWRCVQMTYTEHSLDASHYIEENTYRDNGDRMEDAFDVSFRNDGTFSMLFFDDGNNTESGKYSISNEGKLSWDIETENDSWYIFLQNRNKLVITFSDNIPISDGIYYNCRYYFERE